MIKVRLDRYHNRHQNKFKRLLWEVVWRIFGATTPRWAFQGWRRRLVKVFGARVGIGVQVHGGARIWYPSNIEIGKWSWIGDHATLYSVDKIRIGRHAVVSEHAFLCTAEHDITDNRFELKTAPIEIGDNAWIGARAIVLPGRKVGEGAVVAAGAIVTRDVEPWTVVAGNPARVIKKREIKNPQSDISVIILSKNEKLHMRRCLERLAPLNPKEIFVVDCFSEDGSDKIAAEMGAKVVQHAWPGLYATQFQWALDNLPITGMWILRLDADEYLSDDTIDELKMQLPRMEDDVGGLTLVLWRRFMGGDIRWWNHTIRLLRIFRAGRGKIEQRAMDEHIEVKGKIVDFDGAFYDDNLNGWTWWKAKHLGYAKREAQDAVTLFARRARAEGVTITDKNKISYYRFPPYLRVLIYFIKRYIFELGFMDGKTGWRWHFWQGLWYRWQCDKEIGKLIREGKAQGEGERRRDR